MKNTLSKRVIEEIKNRGIEPRPRWHFLLRRSVIWSLAAFTTFLGGVAIAVIIFVFIDHDANARVYLDESTFEDLLHTIPYLWLAALLLLIGITQYAVRHTKFGYRYRAVRIVGAVVISSLMLGMVLSAFEVGERVQDFLVARVPYYNELVSTSKEVWSRPEKGLLGGTITAVIGSGEITLTDFHDKNWLVDIGRIDRADNSIVEPGSKIKMIGTQEDSATFRALRVLPWNKQI